MWKSAGTNESSSPFASPAVATKGGHAVALLHSACLLAPGIGLVVASLANTNIGTGASMATALGTVVYFMCVFPSVHFTREFRRRAVAGYLAGIIATVVYTAFRLPAVLLGIIPDVPAVIGDAMMDVRNLYWERSSASVALGYVMHLFLTGGAWGSVYAVMARPSILSGLAWAIVIAGVFLGSPLFTTSLTYLDSTLPIWAVALIVWLSHLPYGWTLGFLMTRVLVTDAVRAGDMVNTSPGTSFTPGGCPGWKRMW